MTPAGVRTLPDLATEGRLTGAFLLVAIVVTLIPLLRGREHAVGEMYDEK